MTLICFVTWTNTLKSWEEIIATPRWWIYQACCIRLQETLPFFCVERAPCTSGGTRCAFPWSEQGSGAPGGPPKLTGRGGASGTHRFTLALLETVAVCWRGGRVPSPFAPSSVGIDLLNIFAHLPTSPSLPCSQPGVALAKFRTRAQVKCPASRSCLLGPFFPPAERKEKPQPWRQEWKKSLLRMADLSSQLRIAYFWR